MILCLDLLLFITDNEKLLMTSQLLHLCAPNGCHYIIVPCSNMHLSMSGSRLGHRRVSLRVSGQYVISDFLNSYVLARIFRGGLSNDRGYKCVLA